MGESVAALALVLMLAAAAPAQDRAEHIYFFPDELRDADGGLDGHDGDGGVADAVLSAGAVVQTDSPTG